MLIGISKVTFHLQTVFSKKEKRNLANKFKQKLKNKFNVAVAEVDSLESLDFLTLSLVTVANDGKRVQSTLTKALNMLEEISPEDISDIATEIFGA